jgi:uncharacterized protein
MITPLNLSSLVLTATLSVSTKASVGTCGEPTNSPEMTMSEQDSLHIVQRIYQAIVEGDIPTRLSLVTDDFGVTFFGSEKIPWAGRWRGKDGLGRFLGTIADALEFQVFSPDEFMAAGNNVVVLGHERCRVRATGKLVDASGLMSGRCEVD